MKKSFMILLCVVLCMFAFTAGVSATSAMDELTSVDLFDANGANDVAALDAALPLADETAITLTVFDVRFTDTDGYCLRSNSSSAAKEGNDYWAYLPPNMACPTTVPEPEVVASAWNNCNDYTYKWDNSYIKITMSNTYTISNMRWEGNVLKFTVKDGDANSQDFTLTAKDTNFIGSSAAELIAKTQDVDFGITMADSFDTVKSKIENADSGLPNGIKIGVNTKQNNYKHTAQAGTVENPNGTDGTTSLGINVSFTDEKTSYPVYFWKNSNISYSVNIAVKALAYSEADKVEVTANAKGNGTAKAEFVGMVAQQQNDKSYKWITKYTISATPAENNRLVIWTYLDGTNIVTAGSSVNATITTDVAREYTANFAENTAPTAKTTASTALTTTARKAISQSVSSWFEDYTKTTINEKEYKLNDKLTYSATLDGEALSTTEFSSSGQLKWVTNKAGTYKLVITITDDLGAKLEHEVTITVNASQESQYKVGVSATYLGEPISLGADGLNAEITYAAGYNGDFPLENLENEYYKGDNQYVITINNWKTVRDASQFTEMRIGDLTVMAGDIPTSGSKQFTLNGKKNAFRLYYYSGSGKLVITINYGANKITSASLKEDLILQLAFCDVDKVLKVNAGEHGAVSQIAYKGMEDGKYTYMVTAKPDLNYQLASYTVKGKTEPVLLDLDADSYDMSAKTNVFPIEIEEDTEITLNFAPAAIDLELWSYVPDTSSKAQTASYWYIGIFNHLFASGKDKLLTQFEENATSTPLVPGMGYQFWIKANIKGFMEPNPEEDVAGWGSVLKMYSGDTVNEENLFFDSTDPDTVCDTGTPYAVGKGFVLNGHQSAGLYATVMSCPETDKITVVLKFGGYELQKTFEVESASDVTEAKEFANYYKDTYGLDKFGQELYTEEEKATEGYARYCKYSNFRYVLRLTYNKYYALIALTPAEERAEKLAEGKQALDDAAVGKGYNAVVWSFIERDGVKSIPVMVAVPNDVENYSLHPSPGTTAHDAMCAALEALYPGSWGYTYTATQFGAFVNSVSTGGEDDTGRVHVRISSGGTGANYGFWFYNGKFSDWGVSNYNPYDGDVMWWGGGDVEKYWDWAKLRLYYGGDDEKLTAELQKRCNTTNILSLTAKEIEEAFSDLDDGSGKDFFRRYGQFRDVSEGESVVHLIADIGSVTPDSGEAIKAARAAYDALTSAERGKVTNYDALVEAEKVYAQMTEKSSVSYSAAMSGSLSYMNDANGTNNIVLGVGSTNGEWAVLNLARSGMIKGTDTSGQAKNYLDNLNKELTKGTSISNPTDYARITLALSSLGLDTTADALEQLKDYDAAVEQGINAVAYCLLALDSKPYDSDNTAIREKYINYILNHTCKDGGWLYGDETVEGATADADMTAIVIQALAPYYNAKNNEKVTAAVDKALDVLKGMQKTTGGFASYGLYNAESTAQVIVALTALNLDPTTWNGKDAVDALLHFYDSESGQFKHLLNGLVDQMATEQSTYALVAYNRYKLSQNSLYDMSDAFGKGGAVMEPAQAMASAKLAASDLNNQSVSMKTAGNKDDLASYLKTRLNITGITGASYTVVVDDFTAAVAGTEDSEAGTKGSFAATITIAVEGVSETATVSIKGVITPTKYVPPVPDVTVMFQLLGDDVHSDYDAVHTLATGGLETWIEMKEVTVPGNSTVLDVLMAAVGEDYTVANASGNYISAITPKNGETLGEFTNGNNSGWMYTLNGTHPGVGVAVQQVKDGDILVFHYTDDYYYEESGSYYGKTPVVAADVDALIAKIGEVTKDSKEAIDAARAAVDSMDSRMRGLLKNEDILLAAEKAYAELDKEPVTPVEPVEPGVDVIDPADLPFTDLTENWYKEAIAYVYSYELMNGMSATTFEPQTTLTRAMVATILYRIEGEPAVTGNNSFGDVKNDIDGAWYYNAVLWATQNGIVEGYEDNTFRPVREITREEMAAMMYRYAEYKGLDVSATANFDKFSDGAKVSAWAKPYMSWAVGVNLITGHDNGTLEPQGTATRAQAATVLMRFNEMVK